MKIFFFTGTGNSLDIAKKLAQAFNAELINIAKAMKDQDFLHSDNEIGFVFPLYCYGAPKMVCEFMKNIKTPFVDYMFTVCDGAGSTPGMFNDEAKRYLACNIREISGYYLRSVTNYLPLGDIPSHKKNDQTLARVDSDIEQIIESIRAREQNDPSSGFPMKIVDKTLAPLVKWFFEKNIHKTGKKFSVEENCISCGLCAKVCPAQNIVLEAGRPKWLNHCESCMACIHWCPKRSIQLGSSAKKGRYHHPDIKAEELFF